MSRNDIEKKNENKNWGKKEGRKLIYEIKYGYQKES